MMAKVCWQINDGPVEVEMRDCGLLPIMVRVSSILTPLPSTNSWVACLPVCSVQSTWNVFR